MGHLRLPIWGSAFMARLSLLLAYQLLPAWHPQQYCWWGPDGQGGEVPLWLPAGLVQTHHVGRAGQVGQWALAAPQSLYSHYSLPHLLSLTLSPCMSGCLLFLSLSLSSCISICLALPEASVLETVSPHLCV